MKTQGRQSNGQYAYGLQRVCKCGHTLGQHIGQGPVAQRACIAGECSDAPCNCEGFKLETKRAQK